MAVARIVEFTVPVETSPATTYFNIRYNTDGGTTWTDLNDGGGVDISVSALSSGIYTLDGINSPSGNEAAASYAGNWYQLRLKSASGYGNWSDSFKISQTQGYPDAGDVQLWLTAAGFTFSTATASQASQMELFDAIARIGRQILEKRCGREFLGSGSNSTRYFDPPTNRDGRLRIDDLATLNTVQYQPYGSTAQSLTLLTDFWTLPDNAGERDLPFTALQFRALRWSQPITSSLRRSIIVSGQWGMFAKADGLPEAVWSAMIAAGCSELSGSLSQAVTGGLLSWKEADVQEDWGVEPLKRLRDAWETRANTTIRLYRRLRI